MKAGRADQEYHKVRSYFETQRNKTNSLVDEKEELFSIKEKKIDGLC